MDCEESDMDLNSSIEAHYGNDDLVERIMTALRAAGYDADNPTAEMLSLVDQLHGGGLDSTKAQAELAGVSRGMKVLDAGCGVGGSSRYLAYTYGCRVDAIDLTPQFVETAERLNRFCRLEDMISVRQGSVTDLPYEDRAFDLVWCQNVSMNVEDKPRMFAEAYRVLGPGGRYTLSHLAQGETGEPHYPLPWAREPSYSFIETPKEMLEVLKAAGFVNIVVRQGTSSAAKAPPEGLGSQVVMGPDMPLRSANAIRSREEGRLIGMLIVAERPQ
jgi:ubiquinone/menaquinone biosynthesis C-methylase UbiE